MSGYDYSQDTANEMLEERDKIIAKLEAQLAELKKQEPVATLYKWQLAATGTLMLTDSPPDDGDDLDGYKEIPVFAAPVVPDGMVMVPMGAVERIAQWAKAYPTDIFPEPDFDKVREALEGSGITLDSVSASNMRYVITEVWKLIAAAQEEA